MRRVRRSDTHAMTSNRENTPPANHPSAEPANIPVSERAEAVRSAERLQVRADRVEPGRHLSPERHQDGREAENHDDDQHAVFGDDSALIFLEKAADAARHT